MIRVFEDGNNVNPEASGEIANTMADNNRKHLSCSVPKIIHVNINIILVRHEKGTIWKYELNVPTQLSNKMLDKQLLAI